MTLDEAQETYRADAEVHDQVRAIAQAWRPGVELDVEDFSDEAHFFFRDRKGRRRVFMRIQFEGESDA